MAIFNESYIKNYYQKIESLNESQNKKYKLKGIDVHISKNSNIDKLQQTLDMAEKIWDKIITQAAVDMFNHIKSIDTLNDKVVKYKNANNLKKYIKLESVLYDYNSKYDDQYGSLDLSFDTDPPLDPHHVFTLYVFYHNSKLTFDSVYDG